MPGAPRLLLISSGLCSIAAVMLAVAAVRAPAATRLDYLHVTPAVHAAGAVRQGERIESSFRLTNVSSEVIEILALHPSCSCTLTAMTDKRLSPGESTIVSLEAGVGTARGSRDLLAGDLSGGRLGRTKKCRSDCEGDGGAGF